MGHGSDSEMEREVSWPGWLAHLSLDARKVWVIPEKSSSFTNALSRTVIINQDQREADEADRVRHRVGERVGAWSTPWLDPALEY